MEIYLLPVRQTQRQTLCARLFWKDEMVFFKKN